MSTEVLLNFDPEVRQEEYRLTNLRYEVPPNLPEELTKRLPTEFIVCVGEDEDANDALWRAHMEVGLTFECDIEFLGIA